MQVRAHKLLCPHPACASGYIKQRELSATVTGKLSEQQKHSVSTQV